MSKNITSKKKRPNSKPTNSVKQNTTVKSAKEKEPQHQSDIIKEFEKKSIELLENSLKDFETKKLEALKKFTDDLLKEVKDNLAWAALNDKKKDKKISPYLLKMLDKRVKQFRTKLQFSKEHLIQILK